ncbi:unnamed protein product [Bemisia tabaci]|uniref:Uncharacterized protein n=1 Tax=Bemisia tabaci TaxID=7038 RepID=A0A9P0EZ69_BEMTA|nr:PREDICTED: UPF0587 protein CG4646 [Bemisia tabaci]CAH0381565.1 unnamed protein product [Bemisia tabaci]
MVKFNLMVKADLEQISEVYPNDNFDWVVKVKCTGCNTDSEKWHDINEKNEITSDSKNKGTFHFSFKCKFCSRVGYLAISHEGAKKLTAEEKNFVPLIAFDCRGLEPIDFQPAVGWVAVSDEGTKFQDVSLADGEWCDYDEALGSPVGIYNIEHKFTRV